MYFQFTLVFKAIKWFRHLKQKYFYYLLGMFGDKDNRIFVSNGQAFSTNPKTNEALCDLMVLKTRVNWKLVLDVTRPLFSFGVTNHQKQIQMIRLKTLF